MTSSLPRHGYAAPPRDPPSPTPPPDGRSLLLGPDLASNQAPDREVAPPRRGALPRTRPCSTGSPGLRADPARTAARSLLPRARRPSAPPARLALLRARAPTARARSKILSGAARPILERWFESAPLQATLATDAIIAALASPSTPGTAYVLVHHAMGEAERRARRVGLRDGRDGRAVRALAASARAAGAGGPDRRRGGGDASATAGRRRGAGRRHCARRWPPTPTRSVTFLAPGGRRDLAAGVGRGGRRDRLRERVAQDQPRARASCRTSGRPGRRARPAAPRHDPRLPDARLPRARLRRRQGRPPVRGADAGVHDSLGGGPQRRAAGAPPHVDLRAVRARTACARARGTSGRSASPTAAWRCSTATRRTSARRSSHRQVLSPLDLERRFGLTGGNIFQGAMTPGQLFFLRPVPAGRLPHADPRPLPLRLRYPPRRRRDGPRGYNAAREIPPRRAAGARQAPLPADAPALDPGAASVSRSARGPGARAACASWSPAAPDFSDPTCAIVCRRRARRRVPRQLLHRQEGNIAHLLGKPHFELIRHDVVHPISLEVDRILQHRLPGLSGALSVQPRQDDEDQRHRRDQHAGAGQARARAGPAGLHQRSVRRPQVHPQTEKYWGNVNPIGIAVLLRRGQARGRDAVLRLSPPEHGVDIRVIRIFNTYGPRMHPTTAAWCATSSCRRCGERPSRSTATGPDALVLLRRRPGRTADADDGPGPDDRPGQPRQPRRDDHAGLRQEDRRAHRLAIQARVQAMPLDAPAAPTGHHPRPERTPGAEGNIDAGLSGPLRLRGRADGGVRAVEKAPRAPCAAGTQTPCGSNCSSPCWSRRAPRTARAPDPGTSPSRERAPASCGPALGMPNVICPDGSDGRAHRPRPRGSGRWARRCCRQGR